MVRPRPTPRIVAVANQKGGVGKTTTAISVGAALADLGHRVLLVDLDPQGNATTGLGIDGGALQVTVYDVLLHQEKLDNCIEPTAVRNLFVAPSTLDLAGAEIELVPELGREQRLAKALRSLTDQYDYVLIDCPPTLGLLTVNALVAAREVLVPIQCEFYALEGIAQLRESIERVATHLNPELEISAIVCVMYSKTTLADDVVREVRSRFGDLVCEAVVPRSVRVAEAPSYGTPITVFDPSSAPAEAYRRVAKEFSGGAAKGTR